MKKTLLLMTALCAMSATGVKADILAAWNLEGETGANAEVASSNVAPGVLDSILSASPAAHPVDATGHEVDVYTSQGFRITGISVDNAAYFEFTIEADAGYSLLLSSLTANHGAGIYFNFFDDLEHTATVAWAYEAAGQSSFTLLPTFKLDDPSGNPVLHTYDLSGISALQGISSATFRVFASGGPYTNDAGNPSSNPFTDDDRFGLVSNKDFINGGIATNALTVNGTATFSAVPEPSQWAVVMGLGMGALVLVRMRKRAREGSVLIS